MAETSGFFQAMIDEKTGDYDRKYIAREFANYFALFVKNGVFGSPTNQLRVSPGTGLSISVAPGNAFIKGMWYNNSSNKNIVLVPNYTSSNRVDTVRVRMDDVTRAIRVDVYTGDTELVRTEDIYDLQIATVTVKPNATSITAAEIQDTRPNEAVCGFVTQLLKAETTADLFAQYQAQFDQWFAKVQETLDENTAGNLQNQIDSLEERCDTLQTNIDNVVSNVLNLDLIMSSGYNYSQIPAAGENSYASYVFATISNPDVTPYGYKIFYYGVVGQSGSYSGTDLFSVENFGKSGIVDNQYETQLIYSLYSSSEKKVKTYVRKLTCRGQNNFKMVVGPCYDEEGNLCPNYCIPFRVLSYRKNYSSPFFTMAELERFI